MNLRVNAPSARPQLTDTTTILEKKEKLDTLVEKAKQQILELKDDILSGGGSPTPEQKKQMTVYMDFLKKVDLEQRTLANSIEQADREADLKEQQRRKRAREIKEAKEPPPVYMYELRAMNQKILTGEDLAARRAEAQKVKPVVASGGYTGFRVAPDICKMDFNYFTPEQDDADLLWKGHGAVTEVKTRSRRRS
eukprot:jgi/Botrbrau1/3950/Bobra.0365s0025.1